MTTLTMLILTAFAIGLIVAGLHSVIRLRVTLQPPTGHNEVTAAVYATFGVLYAIILGLLVGHGQERRDMISAASIREASLLVDISEVAFALDSKIADTLARSCLRYAEHVRTVEWFAGTENEQPSMHRMHLADMWKIVQMIEPSTPRQEAVYHTLLGLMSDLASQRYERHAAMGDHMTLFLKVVLIIGAVVTVLFLWFFTVQHHRLHITYTWLVTFIVVLVLMLIFALDDPLRPDIGVEPTDFERASAELRLIISK